MANQTITDRQKQRRIIFCVAAAAFVFQFEAFMVNVCLPTMAGELNATTTEISFIILAYLMAATVTFVPFGKLGDRMGLKRTFIGSCVALTGGTLLSGLSTGLWMLVASRVIQGFGVGGMATLAYAMIPAWIPRDETGRAYGHLNLAAGVGMLAGVPFGGMVAQYASWRWIFFSNAPFIAFLAAFAWFSLPDDSGGRQPAGPLDGMGLALFSTILASVVFGFSLGCELGWTSTPILAADALALTAAAAMAVRQKVLQRPFFSAGMFSGSGFVPSLLVLGLVTTVLGGIMFLVPFYLAAACRLSVFHSSLVLLAYPAVYAPIGPRAGRLADRIGSKPLVLSATLLGACGCLLFSVFLGGGDASLTVIFLFVTAAAAGIFFSPNNKYTMQCVGDGNKGEAASLMPLALNAGTVFGVSVFETVLSKDFPEGAAYLKHAGFPVDPILVASANRGFSDAFLLGFAILLAAAAIVLVYYRTMEVSNRV